MKKIGILSDSHGYTHPRLFDFFKECDEIWHAGDMMSDSILTDLQAITKVRAVYGNCDGWDVRSNCKEIEVFDCEQHKVFLKHIVGRPGKYEKEVLAMIQKSSPTIVVAGHSHILKVQFDQLHQFLFINPGASGKYGIHNHITFLRFEIDGSTISNLEVYDEPR
ncbi:MAG TPA: metallophosphoesterase family protein [Bacteroidales bacterium]|jgi:putative phosphoesterase|nr:metallophosphoesterase family protein [Bacteroidales bacterium]HPS72119.1 metallophosphoesterase family protein [Bacteroidales bacterium]